MTSPRKGLLCSIYSNGTDCSNGGISSQTKQVILVGQGIPEIFTPSADTPAVELRMLGGRVNAKPAAVEGQPEPWWMFGGCFIYTNDSRFPAEAPIALHDRCETSEQSRALSQ